MEMELTDSNQTFREILVAVDDSGYSQSALEMAVDFARRFDAHLKALFVEDIRLIKASKLRTLTEVHAITGEIREVKQEHLTIQLEGISNRLQRLLEFIGHKTGITYSFKSLRGSINETLVEHAKAENIDLVAIGRLSGRIARSGDIGTTAAKLLAEVSKPIMLLNEHVQIGSPTVVVFDEENQNEQLLSTIEKVVQGFNNQIYLVDTSKTEKSTQKLTALIKKLHRLRIPNELVKLDRHDEHMFAIVIQRLQAGMVIASRKHPLFYGNELHWYLKSTSCPLILTT